MRKILSLISCMLSVTIAVAFFAGAALFAMKFGGLKRIITDTADGLWGFDLIARAGLSVVLSVFGIAFSVCVGAFRITAAIYYYKAFRCGAVYKENKAWLLCYSFCAFVMVLLFAFAATGGTVVKAGDGYAGLKTAALNAGLILYAISCVLPLISAFADMKSGGKND